MRAVALSASFLFLPSLAFAGSRMIDADPGDWMTVSSGGHVGGISGDAWTYQGESLDERTDLPVSAVADVEAVYATTDGTNLVLLVKLRDILDVREVHLALGFDTDLDPADAVQSFLGDDSGLGFANDPRLRSERQLAVHSNGTAFVVEWFDNGSWYQIVGSQAAASALTDCVELAVPLADLNSLTDASTFRLTLASFVNVETGNESGDATADVNINDAIDVMGVPGQSGNAFDRDLSDSSVDFGWEITLDGPTNPPAATPFYGKPVASADSFETTEDGTLVVAAPGALATDSPRTGGGPIIAELVSGPAVGMLTFGTDGAFSYVPPANFDGPVSFDYRVDDGTFESATASISILVAAVDDPPAPAADAFEVAEDTLLSVGAASGVLANDTDIDSLVLTAAPATTETSGSFDVSADGALELLPPEDFHGTLVYRYTVADATTTSDPVDITFTVTPVNDLPTVGPSVFHGTEDVELAADAQTGVLEDAFDVDGDVLAAVLVTPPQNGTVTLGSNGGFTFVPDANFHGDDRFVFAVLDSAFEPVVHGTAYLVVDAVNDPPSAPVAIAPDDATPFDDDAEILLSWSAASDVDGDAIDHYVVELFLDGVANGSSQVNGTSFLVPTPVLEGTWTWQVRANDGTEDGDPSASRSFLVEAQGGGGGGGGGGCGCTLAASRGHAAGASSLLCAMLAVGLAVVRRRTA